MNCPKCNSDMAPFNAEGIEMDLCDQCMGCWFDAGELAFYTETTEDVPDIAEAITVGSESGHSCPRCPETRLVEAQFIRTEDLLVDICPSCHGVFLDGGELAKVEALSVHRDVLHKVSGTVRELRDRGYELI